MQPSSQTNPTININLRGGELCFEDQSNFVRKETQIAIDFFHQGL